MNSAPNFRPASGGEPAEPGAAEQSFELWRLLVCVAVVGVAAAIVRNAFPNNAATILVAGVGAGLLVIATRRRHLALAISVLTSASLGLSVGALCCVPDHGSPARHRVLVFGGLFLVGLIVLMVVRRDIFTTAFRALCALLVAVVAVFMTGGAVHGTPLVLVAGSIGSLAGWTLACLPAAAIQAEGADVTDTPLGEQASALPSDVVGS